MITHCFYCRLWHFKSLTLVFHFHIHPLSYSHTITQHHSACTTCLYLVFLLHFHFTYHEYYKDIMCVSVQHHPLWCTYNIHIFQFISTYSSVMLLQRCVHLIPTRYVLFGLLHILVFLQITLEDSLQVLWLSMNTKLYHLSPSLLVSVVCSDSLIRINWLLTYGNPRGPWACTYLLMCTMYTAHGRDSCSLLVFVCRAWSQWAYPLERLWASLLALY